MKKLNPDLLPPALALALFLGVWLIYALPLRAALSYEEQYQLFLSSWGYFAERMSVPGGLADYVSEWMTQWDHYPFAGAALVALTISGVQMMTWVVAKALGARAEHLALSLIPALLLWAYMGDADVLLSFGLSLVGALGLMLAYVKTPSPLWRCVLLVAGAPAGYWLLGPSAGVAVLFGVVVELLHGRSAARVAASVGAALWMALVVIGASYVVPYPLDRMAAGLNYHRFPEHILAPQLALMAVVALTPVAISLLRSAGRAAVVAEAGVVAVAGFFMLRMSFDQRTLDRLEYDYLVRTEQWDAIIAKARSRQPSTPTAVCAVNLALSQRGQLADRLFEFYQNGGSGLIPDFALNMQTPIASAEVFFRLGMINECERYMFEAQEAIPNYRKSGRLTRRIIECQIANGDYATARKLLHMMQKAPVYHRWACEQLTLIGNEKAVAAHPLYGRLRQLRQKMRDFLFSDREVDQMLGLLFTQNKTNRMAYEYLVCYVVLQRDIDKFMAYYSLGRHLDYKRIPRAFQEVLVGNWMQSHKSFKGMPYSVDPDVLRSTANYIRAYASNNAPQESTNAWHYILRGHKPAPRAEASKPIY